jgi:hypothetical protein
MRALAIAFHFLSLLALTTFAFVSDSLEAARWYGIGVGFFSAAGLTWAEILWTRVRT